MADGAAVDDAATVGQVASVSSSLDSQLSGKAAISSLTSYAATSVLTAYA